MLAHCARCLRAIVQATCTGCGIFSRERICRHCHHTARRYGAVVLL
jgi:hypothetical protein